VSDKLCIAEKCGGAMMIGVEEGKRLLLEDEEECVDEFEVFSEIVQLRKSVNVFEKLHCDVRSRV
jgi:hypothetical protein